MHRDALTKLNERIITCEKCPRLLKHCAKVASEKRASFRDWTYWERPVPNFLPASRPASARLLIVGLAPAAHGANRTGRMFTGDRSGDFLYDVMHEAGFAAQATATSRDDGLELIDCVITAACHCAPPANKPTPAEITHCQPWLDQTFDCLSDLRVVLCLGKLAFDEVMKLYQRRRWVEKRSAHRFGHGASHVFDSAPAVLCSYHPSQQNTFTGKLTREMLLSVFQRARAIVEG